MFRILVVDDEPSILRLLKTVLELASFHIETAASAGQAKARLAEDNFDIVLTDMKMETPTSGYDVIRAARQLQPRPAIAILTAFPISPAEWRQSGADAFFMKGADTMSLPNKLTLLLKQRAKKDTGSESPLRRSVNQ